MAYNTQNMRLVDALRHCAKRPRYSCEGCKSYVMAACLDEEEPVYTCDGKLFSQAADAIEELQAGEKKFLRNISAIEKENENLKRARRWIPVTERLPDGEVLAFNAIKGSHGYYEYLLGYVGACSESDTGFRCENEGEILMNVTHWMPLPAPPKEDKP